jgi:hypothetical protein
VTSELGPQGRGPPGGGGERAAGDRPHLSDACVTGPAIVGGKQWVLVPLNPTRLDAGVGGGPGTCPASPSPFSPSPLAGSGCSCVPSRGNSSEARFELGALRHLSRAWSSAAHGRGALRTGSRSRKNAITYSLIRTLTGATSRLEPLTKQPKSLLQGDSGAGKGDVAQKSQH